ncbi:hypothetical protein [Metabacillus sp. RGM 3146]|uniref:hypothetical protein n=1 Tax=Metabacillus sp. RGM 3146 TaxID=3401092 RepID=UPI003B9B427A
MGLSGVENAIANTKEAFGIITSTADGKILAGSAGLISGAGVLGMLLTSPGLAYQTGSIYGSKGQVGLHSLELLAELYSQEAYNLNTVYVATDVISGEEIKLNPAMLYSFLAQCQLGLSDKEKVLKSLKQYLNEGIPDIQDEYKKKLLQKIIDKESNPGAFMVEVGKDKGFWSFIGEERTAESVQFDMLFDKVPASVTQPIEDLIAGIENEVKHLRSLLTKYVANVEKMFEKDDELASLINGMKSELRGA